MKTLKKFVALVSLAALVAGPASALATANPGDITTNLHVITAGEELDGNVAPIVKVKWEEEEVNDATWESGDPSHLTHGSQFNPPLQNLAKKSINVCAIVTDPQGLGTIATVKAEVDGPDCGGKTPYWLYEMGGHDANLHTAPVYNPDTQAAAAIARFQEADNKGLTQYKTGYDYAEVYNELLNGHAAVYCGPFQIDYEDPAGTYVVNVKAQDTLNATEILTNTFYYVPMAGFVTDFSNVNYGSVQLMQEAQVYGDFDLATTNNKPTVKSIGNTRMKLSIWQDKMGLPLDTDVVYAARVGDTNHTKVAYNPYETKDLLTEFALSEIQKMDFWVTVRQTGASQDYSGAMTLSATPLGFMETGCWGIDK